MASAAIAALFKWLVAMYRAGKDIVPLMNEYRALEKQQQGDSTDDAATAITEKVIAQSQVSGSVSVTEKVIAQSQVSGSVSVTEKVIAQSQVSGSVSVTVQSLGAFSDQLQTGFWCSFVMCDKGNNMACSLYNIRFFAN